MEIGTNLSRKDDEGDTDHDHHVELRWPNVGHVIAVTDSWECDDHKVRRLEQVHVPVSSPLEVLQSAHADHVFNIICINLYQLGH